MYRQLRLNEDAKASLKTLKKDRLKNRKLQNVNCCLCIVRSLRKKLFSHVRSLIKSFDPNFLFLIETWIMHEEIDELVEVSATPKGLRFISAKSNDKRGGGLLLIYNSKCQVTKIEIFENNSIDVLLLEIMAGKVPITFASYVDHLRHLLRLSCPIFFNLVTHYHYFFERIIIV